MITLTAAGRTDPGRVRAENEDRWFADARRGVFLVADGMGGQVAGGLAAQIVVEALPALLRKRMGAIEDLAATASRSRLLLCVA